MTDNFREYLDGKKLWQLEDILRALKIVELGQSILKREEYPIDYDVPVSHDIEGMRNEIANRKKEGVNENGNDKGE